jgi:hypothetical protein
VVREWERTGYGSFVDWLDGWYRELPSVPIVGSGIQRGQELFVSAHGKLRVEVERLDLSHEDPPRDHVPGDAAVKVGNAVYVLRATTFRGACFEARAEPSWFWKLSIDLSGSPALVVGLHREDPAYDALDQA